jgi:hypothetical protein
MICSDVSPLRTCGDFLVFAKGLDHAFGNMTVRAESIIRTAEANAVVAIQTVFVSLETLVRCIPLTFIVEWLAKKKAGSTTASKGVMHHDLLTPKQS